jgi:glycosyltransferase involved in cell wall biosynthesis
MRIAVLCSGLDSVQRGYETHQRGLFERLRADSDLVVRLFRRDGPPREGEVALRSPSRYSRLARLLSRWRNDELYWESVFFAIAFVLYCRVVRQRFDKLLVIEPNLVGVLRKVRRLLPGDPRVLFTHGASEEPRHYLQVADEVQEVSVENFRRSVAENLRNKRIWLIPHFAEGQAPPISSEERERLRTDLGIRTPNVLLSVGVVQRAQKRMDYVIEEAARLPSDWSLVLCGQPAEPELVELGGRLMGDRFLQLFLPREEVARVYQIADLLVLGSTCEGFGIVILEAMSHGLPVILHRRELFQWIIKDDEVCIDLTVPGGLADFIRSTAASAAWRDVKGSRNREVLQRHYTWSSVRAEYLKMIKA